MCVDNLGPLIANVTTLGATGFVYIGQGSIRGRLQTHWRNAVIHTRDGSPQQRALTSDGMREYSSVTGPWLSHQRLELETDLIAAHILSSGVVPRPSSLVTPSTPSPGR